MPRNEITGTKEKNKTNHFLRYLINIAKITSRNVMLIYICSITTMSHSDKLTAFRRGQFTLLDPHLRTSRAWALPALSGIYPFSLLSLSSLGLSVSAFSSSCLRFLSESSCCWERHIVRFFPTFTEFNFMVPTPPQPMPPLCN